MRSSLLWLSCAFALSGCNGGNTDDSADPGTDSTFTATGEAQFAFIRLHESMYWQESAFLGGLFVDSRQGVRNTWECGFAWDALGYQLCYGDLPSGGDVRVDLTQVPAFDPAAATYQTNGLELHIGDSLVAHLVNDYQRGTRTYRNEPLPGQFKPGDALGMSFEGDWGSYAGQGDLVFPTTMRTYAPDPMDSFSLMTGESVTFEWEPGEGGVQLIALGTTEDRMWALDDDGSFTLDMATAGLTESGWVAFILQRTAWHEELINGASIWYQATDQQWFEGEFSAVDLGSRQELVPSDTCGDAVPTVGAGQHFGQLADFADDLDPGGDGCTNWSASGPDGFVAIQVGAGQYLSASYDLPRNDASLYLLTDCADATTCLVGTDDAMDAPEAIWWLNDTGLEQTVYLALDAYSDAGLFLLDVEIADYREPDMADDCAGAGALTPLTSGRWFGSFDVGGDSIDPTASTCQLGPVAPGRQDRVLRVDLGVDERFTATVSRSESVAMLLLTDCTDLSTCVEGDAERGYDANISYFNGSGAPQTLELVLDGTGVFQLDVAFDSVIGLDTPDDCADATLFAPMAPGLYYGDLRPNTDSLDVADGFCTTGVHASPGADGVVPVLVRSGEILHATVSMPGHDPVLYLLDSCDTGATCADAVDASAGPTEQLNYRNATSAPQTLFLVIDGYSDTGIFSLELATEATGVLIPGDTCDDALGMMGVEPGLYAGDIGAFHDDLDPGPGGCTGYSADAQDGIVPIDLEPGQTVDLTYSSEYGDGSLYLLSDCSDESTCLVGVDTVGPPGNDEHLSYTNDTSAAQTVYAVLDGYGSASSFVLRVDFR